MTRANWEREGRGGDRVLKVDGDWAGALQIGFVSCILVYLGDGRARRRRGHVGYFQGEHGCGRGRACMDGKVWARAGASWTCYLRRGATIARSGGDGGGVLPRASAVWGALRKWSFIIRVMFRGRTSLGLYHLLYRPFPLLPLRIDFLWSIDGGFLCCVFLIGSFLGIFVQAFTSYVWNLQLWLNFVDLL